jgi:glycosyltransferase involved in cell wall biosynthesis
MSASPATRDASAGAPVSVALLTLNEEANLPRVLGCLDWCDDLVAIDSGSTDRTLELLEGAGARIVHRKLDDWSTHGNFMLREVEYRHPWLYYIDADEWLPPETIEEIQGTAGEAGDDVAACRLRYKNFFRGRWLRHATPYPTWITRLMRPDRCRYEPRRVNAHPVCDGEVRDLRGHFHHFSFHRGLDHWFDKHNRYSADEALETLAALERPMPWGDLLAGDAMKRRRALKLLSQRLPMRPTLKFLYLYLLRRGFLDGRPGYDYCRLQAIYEEMITLKAREARARSAEDDG